MQLQAEMHKPDLHLDLGFSKSWTFSFYNTKKEKV